MALPTAVVLEAIPTAAFTVGLLHQHLHWEHCTTTPFGMFKAMSMVKGSSQGRLLQCFGWCEQLKEVPVGVVLTCVHTGLRIR